MKNKILLTGFFFMAISYGFGQSITEFFSKTDAFMKTHVKDGKVAYANIHKSPEQLNSLMQLANTINVSKDNSKDYQAFWINAYNIAVIQGIINNYPTNSPLDHAGFFDKTTYDLAGQSVTLNEIENKILRAQFKDPRFHFVLVCGAIGCPPLINEAYLPDTLDNQLEIQTTKAINGTFIKVNTKKKRVEGSEILKWYKDDFVMQGNEIDFLNTYRTEKIPTNYNLTYFSYNWNLNQQ